MIENSPQKAAAASAGGPAEGVPAPVASERPAGTVERVLNFQERSLAIFAAQQFCGREGKGDHKAQSKLSRLMKTLGHEEQIAYFDMLDDWLEEQIFRWQRQRNDWLKWQQYLSGGITLEQLKEQAPAVDPMAPPAKPCRAQPEVPTADVRGKERSFYLTSKIDVWVQDILKTAIWAAHKAEYVSELCAKFGIKSDED
jgi:hypothetical protein